MKRFLLFVTIIISWRNKFCNACTIKTLSQIYTAGIQQKLFNNKLTNSYSITSLFGQDNSVYRATVLSRYLFTQSEAVSLSVLYTKFDGKIQTIKSYKEVLASLTFIHSF